MLFAIFKYQLTNLMNSVAASQIHCHPEEPLDPTDVFSKPITVLVVDITTHLQSYDFLETRVRLRTQLSIGLYVACVATS